MGAKKNAAVTPGGDIKWVGSSSRWPGVVLPRTHVQHAIGGVGVCVEHPKSLGRGVEVYWAGSGIFGEGVADPAIDKASERVGGRKHVQKIASGEDLLEVQAN